MGIMTVKNHRYQHNCRRNLLAQPLQTELLLVVIVVILLAAETAVATSTNLTANTSVIERVNLSSTNSVGAATDEVQTGGTETQEETDDAPNSVQVEDPDNDVLFHLKQISGTYFLRQGGHSTRGGGTIGNNPVASAAISKLEKIYSSSSIDPMNRNELNELDQQYFYDVSKEWSQRNTPIICYDHGYIFTADSPISQQDCIAFLLKQEENNNAVDSTESTESSTVGAATTTPRVFIHGTAHPDHGPNSSSNVVTEGDEPRKAAEKNANGFFDFGLEYLQNRTTRSSISTSASKGDTKQVTNSTSRSTNVLSTASNAGGAIGGEGSRKAQGSNEKGIFHIPGLENLQNFMGASNTSNVDNAATMRHIGVETLTPQQQAQQRPNDNDNNKNDQQVLKMPRHGEKHNDNNQNRKRTRTLQDDRIIVVETAHTNNGVSRNNDAQSFEANGYLDFGLENLIPASLLVGRTNNNKNNKNRSRDDGDNENIKGKLDIGSSSHSDKKEDSAKQNILNLLTSSSSNDFSYNLFSPFSTKIVGGQKVSQKKAESKYPFFVQLYDYNCGGSLIAPDMVLSAAHCAKPDRKSMSSLTTLYMLSSKHGQGMERHMIDFIVHDAFEKDGKMDFMLFQIDESALVKPDEPDEETGAKTVVLNRDDDVPADGDDLQAVGFGVTQEGGGVMSEFLNDVTLQVVSYDKCSAQYNDDDYTAITDDAMICAAVEGGGKDACAGDSGGPYLDLHKSFKQVGVTSFGTGCGRTDYAGVIARVSSAMGWIDEHVCRMSRFPPALCHPYIVQWEDCLGVMIAEDIVLTSGHCGHWDDDPLQDKVVSFPAVPNLYRSIVARIVHPNYHYYTRDFDIQLLKLNKTPFLNEDGLKTGVTHVPISRGQQVKKALLEVSITTSGKPKGTTRFSPINSIKEKITEPLFLQRVPLKPASEQECTFSQLLSNDNMLCTVTMDESNGPKAARTCKATSGSPLLDQDGTIVGITSWGKDCEMPNQGAVSSKVSASADFIDDLVCQMSAYKVPESIHCSGVQQHSKYRADGNAQFGIRVQHDRYPEEVSWRLVHPASSTELAYQPYHVIQESGAVTTKTFKDLAEGESFLLEVGDLQNDGICCDYGLGNVTLVDGQGQTLWNLRGGYGAYHAVTIRVEDDSSIVVSDDQDIYVTPGALATQRNMRLYSRDPSTWDTPLWPGVFPDTVGKVAINVKLDMFPEEVHWKMLYLKNGNDFDAEGDWRQVLSVNGTFANQVVSNTLSVEANGMYHFKMIDDGSDGVCCLYRNGWVTITQKSTGEDQEVEDNNNKKIVWRHNGNFERILQVYFEVSEDGRKVEVHNRNME